MLVGTVFGTTISHHQRRRGTPAYVYSGAGIGLSDPIVGKHRILQNRMVKSDLRCYSLRRARFAVSESVGRSSITPSLWTVIRYP